MKKTITCATTSLLLIGILTLQTLAINFKSEENIDNLVFPFIYSDADDLVWVRKYVGDCSTCIETSVYKGYKQDKIEMRGDRAEMSDFPLYLNTVAGGLDCRDQTIGGFSFVVKIYALPVVEIIG